LFLIKNVLQGALKIAKEQKAKSLELRAVVSLARWYAGSVDISSAALLPPPVYDWFSEGLDAPNSRKVQAPRHCGRSQA